MNLHGNNRNWGIWDAAKKNLKVVKIEAIITETRT